MAKEVALREANQQFAKYVRAVEAGESFVIARRGKPVAPLVPIERGKRVSTPEQRAARQRALERMRRGIDMGGARFNRDERAGQALDEMKANITLDKYQDWGQYEDWRPMNIEGMYNQIRLHRRGN